MESKPRFTYLGRMFVAARSKPTDIIFIIVLPSIGSGPSMDPIRGDLDISDGEFSTSK